MLPDPPDYPMTHPGAAVLAHEQARNRMIRQLWLEDRARALVLQQELRGIRAAMRQAESLLRIHPMR